MTCFEINIALRYNRLRFKIFKAMASTNSKSNPPKNPSTISKLRIQVLQRKTERLFQEIQELREQQKRTL